MNSFHAIRLNAPPEKWHEGFPLGTGRIAGMLTGTSNVDRIGLNHERFWTKLYSDKLCAEGAQHLSGLRALLRDGKHDEAMDFLVAHFAAPNNSIDSYQPLGEVTFNFPGSGAGYERTLNMADGTVSVVADGIERVFASDLKRDKICGGFTAQNPFRMILSLTRDCDPKKPPQVAWNTQSGHGKLSVTIPGGVNGTVFLRFEADRQPDLLGNMLLFDGITDFHFQLDCGCGETPEAALNEAAFPAISGTVVDCAEQYKAIAAGIASLDVPGADADVIAAFSYARYLYITGTTHGDLPLNLQGKWNADPEPPWQSDYHLNINLQMNYWPACRFGFSSANRKMLAFFERAVPVARTAAKRFWGTRGIWMSWAVDPTCRSSYGGGAWGVWASEAPWMALHFYEEFEFSQDVDYLKGHIFPYLRECALFYEDFITFAPDGTAVISPSQSPENRFAGAVKYAISLCENSSVDIEIAAELLDDAIAASKLTGADAAERGRWQELRKKIPAPGIGGDGRLLEWNTELGEVEPGHRHISHLFGVWPGRTITARRTPELFEAAKKSLAYRLAHGGGHTGWSRAWCACFKAAFGDGDGALEELAALTKNQCSVSLMDLHPCRGDFVFQIDGNFGAAAAIFAMLVQDADEGRIRLLPALPEAWRKSGSAKRIRVRGGLTFDFDWKDGIVTRLSASAEKDVSARIILNGTMQDVNLKACETKVILFSAKETT